MFELPGMSRKEHKDLNGSLESQDCPLNYRILWISLGSSDALIPNPQELENEHTWTFPTNTLLN